MTGRRSTKTEHPSKVTIVLENRINTTLVTATRDIPGDDEFEDPRIASACAAIPVMRPPWTCFTSRRRRDR
jgi:hypothetical protein